MSSYRSHCLCLTSAEEPSWGDPDLRGLSQPEAVAAYARRHGDWVDKWVSELDKHEAQTGHRT